MPSPTRGREHSMSGRVGGNREKCAGRGNVTTRRFKGLLSVAVIYSGLTGWQAFGSYTAPCQYHKLFRVQFYEGVFLH